MNGRTYCGHYKGYYLKSTLEYIYARYLDYIGVRWDYEIQTFELSTGGSYKPDFYLIDEDRYVEIKGGFNYETDLPRIRIFETDHRTKVDIFQECDLRKLIRPLLTPFYRQVEALYGIQDERTLSKALLGRQTNRKEVLVYFRKLVEKVLGTMGNQNS